MFNHMRLSVYQLQHKEFYQSCGIETQWPALPDMCESHPRVQLNNDYAQMYGDVVLTMIGLECGRLLPYWVGYPQRFTLLLNDATRPKAQEELHRDYNLSGIVLLPRSVNTLSAHCI